MLLMNSLFKVINNLVKAMNNFETKVEEYYQKFCALLKRIAPVLQTRLIPYTLFFFISLMMISPFFGAGFYDGHDSVFHHSQIMSYIESLQDGNIFGYLSPGILGAEMGISIRMMYSSLSHTVVGMLYVYFGQFLGLSVTFVYKFVYFLTLLFSGIFAYELGLKTLKGRQPLAFLVGALFLANPYRFTNVFIRDAFPENFAYVFVPLFFLSLEMILEDSVLKRIRVKSFITLIISTSILLLSHNITALYTVTFGLIYLLINIKRLLPSLKKPQFWAYGLIAVFMCVAIYSPILSSLLVQSDLEYRVYKDVMGANINGLMLYYSQSPIFFECSVNRYYLLPFGIIVIIAVFLIIIRQNNLFKKWRSVFSILLYLLTIAGGITYYIYTGAAVRSLIFSLVALALFFFLDRGKTKKIKEKQDIFKVAGYSALLIITLMLMGIKDIWKIVPSVFLKIQFQFRLWTYLILFAGLVLGSILYEIGRKNYSIVKSGSAFLVIFVLAAPRYVSENHLANYGMDRTVQNVGMSNSIVAGWQYEYFTDELYKTEGFGELPLIFHQVRDAFFKTERVEIEPYAYNRAVISSYQYKASTGGSFLITDIYDETVVILPLLYYHGYELTRIEDAKPKKSVEVKNFHGLVSFDLEQGMEGRYQLDFVGTTSMKASRYILLSVFILFAIGTEYYYIDKKRKKIDYDFSIR